MIVSNQKIQEVITRLSEITPNHLDECSVEDLCQFQYWLQRHQGSVFIKTVGRIPTIANDVILKEIIGEFIERFIERLLEERKSK